MTEEHLIEDEIFEDELEQVWLVAEAPSRDIAEQLADLHTLKGAGFISMLKEITQQRAFTPLGIHPTQSQRHPNSRFHL